MKLWPLWLCPCLLALPAGAGAQVPPEKAEATFQIADGLQMKLWASEPLLVNPTSIDIDHLGRVWVCEAVNYRCKLRRIPDFRKEGDRIVILADSKGQGKADKATVFYQGPDLRAPLGIAVAKDPVGPGWKVYVCQSPDILVFEDKDGDGRADGPPKKLLSGFDGFDHDHGVHGILIGPDLKLYFSVGDQGVHGLQSSDGKGRKWHSNTTDCRAGTIWRCDLDGRNLELIAHNFRNEYEPCVDSFGTIFVSDNDDDGNQQTRICYVMPGGNYGYHPRGPGQSHWHEEQPGVVPKILRTYFGSPTGMCVYEGTLLPKKYWGQLLHTDAGPRHLRCYHLKVNGAGYDVDREDMVTSTDNWFRPSDVCVAPDGSVMVADWYDPGVGGHGMGDITRGRIYRITPKGHQGYNVPEVDLESPAGITVALGSPALSARYMAAVKLQSLPRDKQAEVSRRALAHIEPLWLPARSLWLVHHHPSDYLAGAAVDGPLYSVRLESTHLQGVRQLAACYPDLSQAPAEARKQLRDNAARTSPAVRREILLALRSTEPGFARPVIMDLAGKYDGKDRYYLEAIGIAVGHHDKARREMILADFDEYFPEWNDKVADLVWELRPPVILESLGKRLTHAWIPPQQRARMVDILAASDDPSSGRVLLGALTAGVPAEVRSRVLENLEKFLPGKWAGLRQSRELAVVLDGLLASPESRSIALSLIAAARRVEAIEQVSALAASGREPAELRRQALRTLGKLSSVQAVEALKAFVSATGRFTPDALNALGTLAASKNAAAEAALQVLQDVVTDKAAKLETKLAALSALAGSRAGTTWMLALHEKGQLDPALKGDAAGLLRNSPYPDLRNKALIAFPPPGKLDPKQLPSLAALAVRKGDVSRGQQLLDASLKNDLQCLKCHSVRGVGGQVGPDLSMIGKKASKENLFESILYPSKAIADQYVNWQIETTRGLSLSGLLVEESAGSITLRDGNGKDTRIAKKDIDSRTKSPKSLMPEDLLAYMSEDDLVDLVACLMELKTPALTVDAWHIAGPFDNGAADAGLDVVYPPEKGVDLNATYPGKSAAVRWQTVRPDAQGYVDLMAHFAGQSDNIVSYLYQEIDSPQDQEVTLLLGTDDGCKLWVNDRLVHTDRQHRAAAPAQHTIPLRLRKGSNRIVLKINNGNGPHGFYFTLLAEQELKRAAPVEAPPKK
jgi:putative membrane-bound dehydrogenase-like protein